MRIRTTTSSVAPNLVAARALILKTLGVSKVAAWCRVKENTVYQWLSRGTDLEPFPADRAMQVANAAKAEGCAFDLRLLIPGWLL